MLTSGQNEQKLSGANCCAPPSPSTQPLVGVETGALTLTNVPVPGLGVPPLVEPVVEDPLVDPEPGCPVAVPEGRPTPVTAPPLIGAATFSSAPVLLPESVSPPTHAAGYALVSAVELVDARKSPK